MEISRIFAAAAVTITLITTTAFAGNVTSVSTGSTAVAEARQHIEKDCKQKHAEFSKDPIKALENRKLKIQSLLKEGKITREKADKMTARVDSKIAEIQSFNKLTLQQKKEKLIYDCRSSVEKLVKEGKLDKAEADTIFKKYSEKINNWDGSGYPEFHSKRLSGSCK